MMCVHSAIHPVWLINIVRRSRMSLLTHSGALVRRSGVLGSACALALALAIPGAAFAANAQDQTAASGTAQMRTTAAKPASRANAASHVDRVEARIRDLHAKLAITPAQEDQWKAVASVMRENAQTLDSIQQSRLDNASQMTAVDDVKSYSELADAHAQGLKNFVPAFQALYDSLSPAQQKNADQMFRGRMQAQAAARGPTKGS